MIKFKFNHVYLHTSWHWAQIPRKWGIQCTSCIGLVSIVPTVKIPRQVFLQLRRSKRCQTHNRTNCRSVKHTMGQIAECVKMNWTWYQISGALSLRTVHDTRYQVHWACELYMIPDIKVHWACKVKVKPDIRCIGHFSAFHTSERW